MGDDALLIFKEVMACLLSNYKGNKVKSYCLYSLFLNTFQIASGLIVAWVDIWSSTYDFTKVISQTLAMQERIENSKPEKLNYGTGTISAIYKCMQIMTVMYFHLCVDWWENIFWKCS